MKIKIGLLSIILFSALFMMSCNDYSELEAPVQNGISGDANFSKFVSIGNSITAGYQSGTIYESGQMYAYGNLIAKQVGVDFQTPYVSDPGLGGRMEVQSLSPFTIKNNTSSGSLLNANYPAPYNNLGVPGALTYDVLLATNSTNCASALFANTPNPYFDVILRNSVLNKGSQLQQSLSLAPTFITLWIGNNDVLGYATSGGTSPTAPTSVAQFNQLYGGIMQGLKQYTDVSAAKVVVANIPSVSAIPFFTTVGPVLATNPAIVWWQIALAQTASGLPATGLIYGSHEGGTNLGQLPYKIGFADSVALLTGTKLITLLGQSYAPLLGQPTGKFYRDYNIPVPLGVDTTKAFGFHPQNPFPDLFVLDSDEITTASNAVSAFNSTIAALASANGYGLVDINTKFNQFRAADFTGGTVVNGITFKTTYISGGLFSLDGVHPSSQAHGIVANEFINVINSKYGANIPLVDVSAIPGSIYFTGKISYKDGYPVIPKNAFDHLLF
ncbi:MAG: SGNH/GDSL hydrolase family protein [Ignavibacterium sp.]|nr:SGNH/GDSL hydrolase family protein [Ignavibacterium sp.]